MRLIVGMSGASGALVGVRVLELLAAQDVETHLVMSTWAARTIEHETTYSVDEVKKLASVNHSIGDQAATISSGSFRTDGMVIVPCSMKTLAAIAHGYGSDLLTRSADVVIKERRRLVVVAREAPLSSIHLRNMLTLSDLGATIMPPAPSFYNNPATVDELINDMAGRIVEQFGLEPNPAKPWNGQLLRRSRSGD